jgi:hypothetical protein
MYSEMTMFAAKRLKVLEDGNPKQKKLLVEQMLDMAAMRELLQKNGDLEPWVATDSRPCRYREVRSCLASAGPSWVVGTSGVRDCRGGPQDGARPVAARKGHGRAWAAAGFWPMKGVGSVTGLNAGGSSFCSGGRATRRETTASPGFSERRG